MLIKGENFFKCFKFETLNKILLKMQNRAGYIFIGLAISFLSEN